MARKYFSGDRQPNQRARDEAFDGYMARHHDDLMTTMTDEQKDIFERFDDCWSEYASLAEKSIFVYLFRLGANIAIDILSADYRS